MRLILPSFRHRLLIFLFLTTAFTSSQGFAAELNIAPDCTTAAASPALLWPANHKFVNIDIAGVTDPDNDLLSISIQCILQDEELNATGDGNFIYDADGINTQTASLRSERSGNNNGRVYHVDFIATDSDGSRCGGEVTVSVPHNSNKPAIDEGRLFQSVPSDNTCGLHDINNIPWIYSEPILTGATYERYQYDVNGHDPDLDILTYSIVAGPSGLEMDPAGGLLSWQNPEAGTFPITVRIDDGRGGTDEQSYDLFINGPPKITSEPTLLHQAGSPYKYQVTSIDPNDDILSYLLVDAPSGMTIEKRNGLISWLEPTAGEFPVSIRVEDEHGGSDLQEYVLFINAPPVILSTPVAEQQTGTPYTYQVIAEDPNNDTLSYELSASPTGMNIDPSIGLITWEAAVAGTYEIQVKVDDSRGGTTTQNWSLFINGPPVITSTPITELLEGNAYSYQVTASDPNNDELSYTLSTGPAGLVLDAATGLITWTAPTSGEHTIALKVSDNHGGTDEQIYTLDVIPLPTVTLEAGAEEIRSGESTALSWSSTNADTLDIDPGIGEVAQSGIISVSPSKTTTYTITASGRGGSATDSVTITVTAPSIDLIGITPDIDDALCPDSVFLTVQVQNTGEGIAEAGVPVAFYNGNPREGGILLGTAATDAILDPGASELVSLQWPAPPVGTATIYIIVDDSGNGNGSFEEVNENNNLVTREVSLCEDILPPNANSISGEVIDAVTGKRLSNVVVDLHVSDNGEPGTIVSSFRTNYEGIFIFRDLDPGSYIITGTVTGYAVGERRANLTLNAVLEHQDLVLSPLLGDDDIRIVLTWGQYPEDLEAHLTEPNSEGCRHHCFYWNQEIPGANLDLDDRHSYGPETITITDPVSGTYRYYVHNFSNRTNMNNYYLSYYGAEVKVYLAGAEEPLVFTTPEYRYTRGTVWHVFDIDGDTGAIIPVNKFTHQSEPGQIDFPRITSRTPLHSYWGQPYTYQVTAEDPDDDPLTFTLLQGPEGMTIDPETGLIEWIPLGIPDYRYPVEIKVSDGRCGEDTQFFYLYTHSTPVVTFKVDPCSAYNENGEITLTWNTSYAKTILIDQGIGEVEASGSLTIPSPVFPVVYTLTAFNDAAATVRRVPTAQPGASIGLSPYLIEPTHQSKLSWSCGCAATCEIDQGIGKVTGTGWVYVSPLDTTTYTITASNAVGERIYARTLQVGLPKPPPPPIPPVIPPPRILSFTATPNCDWSPPEPITLSWATSNATTCEISPDIGQVGCNSSIEILPETAGTYTLTARGDGGVTSRSVSFPPLPSTYRRLSPINAYVDPGDEIILSWSPTCTDYVTITDLGQLEPVGSRTITVPDDLPKTYTMTAFNEAGSNSYSITLRGHPPTGTFTTDDSVIKVGESAILRWTSQRADICTLTPDIGEVDCAGDSVTVTPEKPSYYYLKIEGPGGTKTYYLYVNFVPPDLDIQATPETITEGGTTTLSWVFSNATICEIDQGIGEVQLGQTLDVSPPVTTTYKMTATGPGGTRWDEVTVNVIPLNPPPTATITVNPGVIWNGEESILSWSSEYAETVSITPDIGAVASSGTQTINPEQDTTYTIATSGAGGTATAKVKITVLQYTPTASLAATPENIELGGSAVLSWNTEYADTVTITPDIGTVAASGSVEVSPANTTTYQLTAKGPGGTAIDLVTVSYPVPTVSITADPTTINYPDSATLIWSSTDATTVNITPDIGTVNLSGSIDVSPLANTTYTITATGPGGSINETATVTVLYPQPTATLTVQPDTVNHGDSTQLTWSSQNADSCSITPDIGSVTCNGSKTITPDDTTTYTLVATGPGGSANTSTTLKVIFPEPTVTISADPSTIEPGGSATLHWTSTDADSVTIEPGIGEQPPVGQVTVTPTETTMYTITGTGKGGSSSASTTVTVAEPGPITLTITSPAEGEAITRTDIMVTGTVNHANGLETGVVVNGIVALVYNEIFVANHVPLNEGSDTIIAIATDINGDNIVENITIQVQPNTKHVDINANPELTLTPMETDFTINSNFPESGPTNLSYSGPGDVDYLASSKESYTVSMADPGLYYFTGTATDEFGDTYSDTMAILAMDRESIDALLQVKWDGMKEAMISGDIEGAVSYFVLYQQETFREIYTLAQSKLAEIATNMQPIELIYMKNDSAEYRLNKDIIFNNEPVTVSFHVYFQREADGIWRIRDY